MCPATLDDDRRRLVIGVLSDTHGHLYPRVKDVLRGVDHIIHAGDVGSARVLAELKAIAPVTAVRGNCDLEDWARMLPTEAELELGGVRILVGHIASRLRERLAHPTVSPGSRRVRVVITGHSHRMDQEERDGVLHLNPGSAGPERFGHPRTLARLLIVPASADGASDPGGLSTRVDVEFAIIRGD